MAKLKLKGLLLKGVHTLLVKHVQKKLPLKGRVLDADLEIRWGGGSHSDSQIRRGVWSPKKFFAALSASLWSKNKGVGGWAPPVDPPLLHIFSWSMIHISSAYPRGRPLGKPGKYVGNTRGQQHCVPIGWQRSRTIFQLQWKGVGLCIPDTL